MTLVPSSREVFPATRPYKILIVAALPQEVRPFLRRVKARVRRGLGLPSWELESGSAVLALSGMGGGPARRAAETLIQSCRPKILVSLGFGGALAPELAAGDLVLGAVFWDYNPDTRELKAGPRPLPPRPLAVLCDALKAAGLTAATGTMVTTARIIHKGSQGELLGGLPQVVLDLETGVLAEFAASHGLPFLSLRAITDTAVEEIPEFLRDVGHREGAVRVRAAVTWVAEDFRRLVSLLGLWRRSRRAGRVLSEALTILIPLLSDR